MAFNPLKMFNKDEEKPEGPVKEYLTEEIKTKPLPKRGPGGKFVSKKKKEEPSTTSEIQATPEKTIEVTKQEEEEQKIDIIDSDKDQEIPLEDLCISTFYGKEVRRFYHKGKWYFVIDDIISLAAADSLNLKINLGDPEKLAEESKKIAKEFRYKTNSDEVTVKAALAPELIKLMPYIRGLFPGPFVRWINETSAFPAPVVIKEEMIAVPAKDGESSENQVHPSDAGSK